MLGLQRLPIAITPAWSRELAHEPGGGRAHARAHHWASVAVIGEDNPTERPGQPDGEKR